MLGLEAISLLASLLQLRAELVEVLLEVSRALHSDLEAWVRSSLDPDDTDVAPVGEHVDDLRQLGHPLRSETLKDQRLVLVQVEHVFDNAYVLVGGQTYTDRQKVGEVLLAVLSGLSVTARIAVPALALRGTSSLVGVRSLAVLSSLAVRSSFAAILAGSRVPALLAAAIAIAGRLMLLLLVVAGIGRVGGRCLLRGLRRSALVHCASRGSGGGGLGACLGLCGCGRFRRGGCCLAGLCRHRLGGGLSRGRCHGSKS